MTEIDPLVQRSQAVLEKLIALQSEANVQAIAAANEQGRQITTLIYGLALAVTLAAIILAWVTTRSITLPINDSVKIARRVSQGDLTAEIQVTGRDEPAQLQAALREMNTGLGGIVQHIRVGSEAIAVGAGQVA